MIQLIRPGLEDALYESPVQRLFAGIDLDREPVPDETTILYFRRNKGFFVDSPGVDGGIFDIDNGNINNTMQYNFGHDSQGYCVSIFGAENKPGNSINSIVRRNLCINNGRSPRLAKRQATIFLYTWKRGPHQP